jgi:hypothetical protein
MEDQLAEPLNRTTRILRGLQLVLFALSLAMAGACFGGYQMAIYMADQIEAQFHCEPK